MSASAIIDGLITMLSASAFGTGGVSQDYGVLESTSGSCAVINLLAVDETESTFANGTGANNLDRNWTFSIATYSKDTGNATQVLARIPAIADSVLATLKNDRTIGGNCEKITAIRGQRELPPGGAVQNNSGTWLELLFEVDVLEFSDG